MHNAAFRLRDRSDRVDRIATIDTIATRAQSECSITRAGGDGGGGGGGGDDAAVGRSVGRSQRACATAAVT